MSHPGRVLPPLNDLLQRRRVRAWSRSVRREVITRLIRELLEEERGFLGRGRGLRARYGEAQPDRALLTRHLEDRLVAELESLTRPGLRRVINASGVLLHTNLGRAVLSTEAREELLEAASHPVALEIDLESGQRGSRNERVGRWLRLLTGAEAGLAVNNGAAALWLAVHGLGRRRRALISRGEQVAIGGSFRMPELMQCTGARIIEVGTTNKTRSADYARELREGDLVLKVHPSNYRVEGFTEEVRLAELAALCRERNATLIFDAGSGCLLDLSRHGMEGEATVQESLDAGAHLVTFSGDKLLGGPQAGLIVGERERVRRLATHPMQRALRLDKLALAALEATLRAYARPGRSPALPLHEALSLSRRELQRRGREMAGILNSGLPSGWKVAQSAAEGAVGGGAYAERPVASRELQIQGPDEAAVEALHASLRRGDPAILTRIRKGVLGVDLRSPEEEELAVVADRIIHLVHEAEAKR